MPREESPVSSLEGDEPGVGGGVSAFSMHISLNFSFFSAWWPHLSLGLVTYNPGTFFSRKVEAVAKWCGTSEGIRHWLLLKESCNQSTHPEHLWAPTSCSRFFLSFSTTGLGGCFLGLMLSLNTHPSAFQLPEFGFSLLFLIFIVLVSYFLFWKGSWEGAKVCANYYLYPEPNNSSRTTLCHLLNFSLGQPPNSILVC